MSESLQIQVSHADVGRRFDQLVIGLVVLAIGLTWLSGPGNPWRFAGFAAPLGLSWLLPRVFNASRRAGACNPASLCAQARVQYRQPEALQFLDDGMLLVRWQPDGDWATAVELRTLWLGPLLHVAAGTSPLSSTHAAAEALNQPLQRGSCLLWLPRLGTADAAAVRRWLVWRRRGGRG